MIIDTILFILIATLVVVARFLARDVIILKSTMEMMHTINVRQNNDIKMLEKQISVQACHIADHRSAIAAIRGVPVNDTDPVRLRGGREI